MTLLRDYGPVGDDVTRCIGAGSPLSHSGQRDNRRVSDCPLFNRDGELLLFAGGPPRVDALVPTHRNIRSHEVPERDAPEMDQFGKREVGPEHHGDDNVNPEDERGAGHRFDGWR